MALALAAAAFLTACSDETTNVTETTGPTSVAKFKDLAKCTAENEGELVYVKDSAKAYLCAANEWTNLNAAVVKGSDGKDETEGSSCTVKAIAGGYKVLCGGDSVGVLLNGSKGDRGIPGIQGIQGDQGEPGENCTVEENKKNGYDIICGDKVVSVKNGTDVVGPQGESCTGETDENGNIRISCGKNFIGELHNGNDGKEGKSAYEIAKDNDESITDVNSWLESLKGDPGTSCTAAALSDGSGIEITCGGNIVGELKNGANGKSAFELAQEQDATITSVDEWMESLKGKNGENCTIKGVDDGVEITCNGDTKIIKNGKDGADGKRFVDGWMVDPRDKQLYRVVTIGEQTWMAENLNYVTTEGSYCYGETEGAPKTGNCTKYGRLYLWSAAVGKSEDECGFGKTCGLSDKVRGVCPEGWHLPDTTEWSILINYAGGVDEAGKALKAKQGWYGHADLTNDDVYGFSALPAGSYFEDRFAGEGYNTCFWSATDFSKTGAYCMDMSFNSNAAKLDSYTKAFSFSVRCLQD